MTIDFRTALEKRRSIYSISKESPISDDKIIEIVNHSVKYTPSAFNSQSARVVILFGEEHNKLWDITMEALRKIVSAENFPQTESKINSFKAGYGSVLFFEDESVIKGLQAQFSSYKDNFPIWSQQSSGMLQFNVWTSLELEGLGASLQHYNPLIDDDVREQWKIPAHWRLVAQLPFGKPTEAAGDKNFIPVEDRVKVFR
ncbi:nitroreductase family protein [Alkaliphilus transvaalensis]|uniref:nitroreductase family protein n=1 Tax=Alkaliphilus transvaalensis TaxID=114628 RepID=UPI00047AFA55|nr:nitroreductase family protein [Alkaliphilus transvaalensis]